VTKILHSWLYFPVILPAWCWPARRSGSGRWEHSSLPTPGTPTLLCKRKAPRL